MSTQFMVDLETAGKRPGCKILSIGAVVFGPAGMGAEFYVEVNRSEQGALHEDPSTLEWWAKQEAAARDRLFSDGEHKLSLPAALIAFNEFIARNSAVDAKGGLMADMWGNGSDFDNVILMAAYDATGIEQGWPYWGSRCYRTLKGLKPAVKLVRQGVHHNALDDAKTQAEHAVRLHKELGLWV